MKEVPITTWHGCYDRSWGSVLIKDAYKHPAKFAIGLVERLLDYGIERGWWKPGDDMGDPFGGIGGGAIPAADRGFRWIGSELEEQFVTIGNKNLDAHAEKWRRFGRPLPKLVQGDSRKFAEVVKAIVTSPPFTTSRGGAQGIALTGYEGEKRRYPQMKDRCYLGADGDRDPANIEKLVPGKLDAAVTSPPYATISAGAGGLNHKPAKQEGQQSGRAHAGSQDTDQRYGDDPAQIAKLKDSPLDAAITSPPHANTMRGQKDGIDWDKAKRKASGGGEHQKQGASLHATYGGNSPANIGRLGGVFTSPPFDGNRAKGHVGADKFSDPAKVAAVLAASGKGHSASPEARQRQLERDRDKTYGSSEGQIDGLPSGTIDAAVTSPPYEASKVTSDTNFVATDPKRKGQHSRPGAKSVSQGYGETEGQIGRAAGETYWQAMAKVYASCFEAIKPGGYLACVVKDYVRDFKRVPLCDDTMRLLEHVGFEPIERIHAYVTQEIRHPDLFEGETVKVKSRKSFFRRLQESRGAPPIDYEQVLIVRKPL